MNGCGSHLGLFFLGTLALGLAGCHVRKKVQEPMKCTFCEEQRPHSNSHMSDLEDDPPSVGPSEDCLAANSGENNLEPE